MRKKRRGRWAKAATVAECLETNEEISRKIGSQRGEERDERTQSDHLRFCTTAPMSSEVRVVRCC